MAAPPTPASPLRPRHPGNPRHPLRAGLPDVLALLVVGLAGGWGPAAAAQPAQPAKPSPDAVHGQPSSRSPATPTTGAGRNEPRMRFDPTTGRYMPASEQLAWRNSFLRWDHFLSTHSFSKGAQLSYDPTYFQILSLRPRWSFTDSLSLRLRQDVLVELTTPNAEHHRALLYDLRLDLVEAHLLSWRGFILGLGGRVLLPTGTPRASSGASTLTRGFGTGALLSVTRSFAGVLDGLVLQLGGTYTRFWNERNVAGVEPGFECLYAGLETSVRCGHTGGFSRPRDQITADLGAQLVVYGPLSVSMGMTWLWQAGHGLADARIPVDTGEVTLPDGSQTHWRAATIWSTALAYQATRWLQASGGLYTFTPQLDPDGSRRNPFFNADTYLRLGALVTLDQLYAALR